MKYTCIEQTIDITNIPEYEDISIRLWINSPSIPDFILTGDVYDYYNRIRDFITRGPCHKDHKQIIEFCSSLPNVNAIQVKERIGHYTEYGVVVYTVDFNGDVHG